MKPLSHRDYFQCNMYNCTLETIDESTIQTASQYTIDGSPCARFELVRVATHR